MPTIYDVDPTELINETANELKSLIKQPEWTFFVKTGVHKERSPVNKDWWFTRCASILRKVYLYGPIGTPKLRTFYGGIKNRGMKPERYYKGSGSIIRKALQELENAELIKKSETAKKGRIVSAKGQSFMDKIATKIHFENKSNKKE